MYRKKLMIVIFIVLVGMFMLTVPASFAANAVPQAKQGILDVSGGELAERQWTTLDGEWALYWGQLLEPGEWGRAAPVFVTVPDVWKNYGVLGEETAPTNRGYATYRLDVVLPPEEAGRTYAIYVPSVATAYKLWIDGEYIGGNGLVGTSREDMVPKNVPKVYYFTLKDSTVEVVLQVSNFIQRKGGLWESIRFGTSEAITWERNKTVIVEMAVLGTIGFMGIYHLGMYAYRRNDRSPLYFGGLCLAVSIRVLFLGETLAVYLFPGIPWEAAAKVEYISGAIGFTCLLHFACAQYPQESHRFAKRISVAVTSVDSLIVLAAPASFYTEYFIVHILWIALPTVIYVSYVYIRAAVRRRPGSLHNIIGFAALGIAIGHDALFYLQQLSYGNVVPFGLVAALFTQSFNLANRFLEAYRETEHLAGRLKLLNETLEERVERRTLALQDANARLAERNEALKAMEQSRRQLLSTISHELGTPLTSIQGYVKLMLDGVISEKDDRVLKLIYDKTLYLDRIIHDLFELSKLEAKAMQFDMRQVSAAEFLRQLSESYRWSGEEAGIQITVEHWRPSGPEREWLLTVDPVRIEQVFANFISNAKKFTPSGGNIRIHFDTVSLGGSPAVKVMVADTGIGIPQEELPRVFDRFYKGKESAAGRSDGAGLGLAIAKEIIEQHHGIIGIDSVPARGSEFYFTLPLKADSSGGA